jgi:hypothetical protein
MVAGDRAAQWGSFLILPIAAADGFEGVGGEDGVALREIGDRAGDAHGSGDAAGGEAELLGGEGEGAAGVVAEVFFAKRGVW